MRQHRGKLKTASSFAPAKSPVTSTFSVVPVFKTDRFGNLQMPGV